MQTKNTMLLMWKKNVEFWTNLVPKAWDRLPLDGKLAWIMIITYTICFLTLMEVLLLK